MLGLRQKRTFWASTGISGTSESLTEGHLRLSISFLGSCYNVPQTVALSQARWPTTSAHLYVLGWHRLAHLYLIDHESLRLLQSLCLALSNVNPPLHAPGIYALVVKGQAKILYLGILPRSSVQSKYNFHTGCKPYSRAGIHYLHPFSSRPMQTRE